MTGTGRQLLSCYIPIAPATFYDVVGREPQSGESVTALDPASQTYTTTTYDDGVWNNGAPDLAIGQSAFFNLEGPYGVPEPAVGELAGVGLLGLAVVRRWRRGV